ncbi:MAG: hypothetical protein ACK5M4_08690 [Pseudorhodobacter sp.]
MAYATTTATQNSNIRNILIAPFRAVWNSLIMLAETGPRMEQIRKLNDTTDEELAARGLTREGEIQRIFSPYMYL